ncbi:PREDICTED: uncharacterized protein LOC109177258 [Ipomoea nil]|uniref:uncharacterized protein LOC109177258 n=1 Tax=Ipomoea nil TaxID=35883 RepID=UPI000901863E|nr:PREDICTED: uncharacterized protein LOC109177258 [Ipomoea nil]
MSYSPEAISRPGPSPERAAAQDTSSSSSGSSSSSSSGSGSSDEEEEGTTSGRQGSPTEGVRETPTRVVGDHPSPAPEPTEEDTAGPAAPAVAEFEFLNSENVEQQMSLLTKGEAARIAERLVARGTEIEEELIVSFGRWGFTAGKRKMLERVRSRLEQALDGEDLQLVLSALPPDLADPGPSPFAPKAKAAEPGALSAAPPSGKEAAAGAREAKK